MRASRLPAGLSLGQPATLVATVGGVGLLPWAPGTWGSLVALPLGWLIDSLFGPAAFAFAIALVVAAGWWASAEVTRRGGEADPSCIVVDEVAGQLVALAAVPADPLYYALAFLGFRVLDVLKPWPIRWADREVKGGLGVMLDDLLAGAAVALAFVAYRSVAAG
ncbi:MAG: phosphatidylglycerophosphatase A [Alphaproteobacteria bacterium]